MQVFELIKEVLDEAYETITGDEAQRDVEITKNFKLLSDRYQKLWDEEQPLINYREPSIRFAYIYRYVTSHANLVCSMIDNTQQLSDLFKLEHVKASCIGGGPGSDLLGILKYCNQIDYHDKLRCNLLDRDPSWNDSWTDVDDKVDANIKLSTSFIQVDVTKPETWKPHTKYLDVNLFTMIYFMSEVYKSKDEAEEYFDHLFGSASSGSLMLFVDNNSRIFYDWFDDLADEHNWVFHRKDEDRFCLPFDEEKRALGRYYMKFSDPKITARIAFRVIEKK